MNYVGLIRGINIGGHKKVAMADVRAMLARLGFEDVRSLLNSGNAVFSGAARPAEAMERLLEGEMAKRFGLQAHWFVRTGSEWADIVRRNPFPEEAGRDPGRLVAICMKDAPAPKALKALQASIVGPEIVRAHGRQVYATYPAGQGTSDLTLPVIEKALGTRGTGRNWNTVIKLNEALKGLEG